jgi:hypothetical protein
VVRIGDTVRRPAGHWRASVHDLLRHLLSTGLKIVPEPLGIDESGRKNCATFPDPTKGGRSSPKS